MTAHLLRRLASLVPILVLISFAAFLLANFAPGDPAEILARQRSPEPPTRAEIEDVRTELGLRDPFTTRYLRWASGALRGDLGDSFQGDPVAPTLLRKFGSTLKLAIPALLLSMVIAVPVGLVSALRRGSLVDHGLRSIALVGASVPSFGLAYFLIIVFAVKVHLLPVAGEGGLSHLVLPTVTLSLAAGASLGRLLRSSILDTLGDDYVRTARAKGLPWSAVLSRHALHNSLLPIVTVLGLRFGRLLAGSAIVETVFNWPGVGRHIVDAVHTHDYPSIQGFVLFAGTTFVLVNLAVDLLHQRLDPRIRGAGGRR